MVLCIGPIPPLEDILVALPEHTVGGDQSDKGQKIVFRRLSYLVLHLASRVVLCRDSEAVTVVDALADNEPRGIDVALELRGHVVVVPDQV